MEERTKIFVGLDVHKESIAMAVADSARQATRLIGTLAHDLNKLLKKLQTLGEPSLVHVVYEAGPTGYGLQRALAAHGYVCEIIAPSLIPKRPGDRIKTDRRDCLRLAELSRAGELTAIWIPDPTDEAIRDLTRAREDAVNARTQVRQQLKSFLLRHAIRYPGKTAWTQSFHRWLGTLRLGAVSSQEAFVEYRLAVEAADKRVERMTRATIKAIEGWRFEHVVKALCALRGVDVVSAIGLVAEIGDIGRFDHPRKLMGYLGLVPSEHSSGDRVSCGSITKTGNGHARRLLTEAAWSYRFKPKIGYAAQRRQQDLPDPVRGIAWKAQLRLTERFATLHRRGVAINKVCVAVARELAGFVWAIAREAQTVAQPDGQASSR